MSSNNNKQFAFNQLDSDCNFNRDKLCTSRSLPFPISIEAIVGVFIVLGYFMRNRMSGKMGMRGGLRGTSGTTSRAPGDSSLKYYCMIWHGTQANRVSKMWFEAEKGRIMIKILWTLQTIRKMNPLFRPPKIRK